jgi:hypothetical protein
MDRSEILAKSESEGGGVDSRIPSLTSFELASVMACVC